MTAIDRARTPAVLIALLGATVACSPSHVGGDPGPVSDPTTSPASPSASSTPPPAYQTYRNARFGFSVQLPGSFRTGERIGSGDGERFVSADGTARVTVSAGDNGAGASPATALADYEVTIRRNGGRITFGSARGDAYVCSGYAADGSIFYQRQVVGPTTVYTVAWAYPQAEKTTLDAAVQKSVDSFVPGPL